MSGRDRCASPRSNTPNSACAQGLYCSAVSDHMEDDDQDREDEEIGQGVEVLEREAEVKATRDNERSDT